MTRKIPKYDTQEYWKSANEYQFDMNTGEKLHLYAHSERIAKIKAKAHERWLKEKGFKTDKVLIKTIKRMVYQ